MPASTTARDWKTRCAEIEASLQRTKARLATVQARLHWHERALLRPEMLEAMLPHRADAIRKYGVDDAARRRDAAHLQASPAYRAAVAAPAPDGAETVRIGGLDWWVPADARVEGRLSDRLLRERRLPLRDILRTREAVGGGIMLDVGANIGTTSVPRAVLGDVAAVYAAEPDADNFACLVHTVVVNSLRGLVLPDHLAISDRSGTATLQRSKSIGGHRLGDAGASVPVLTLDAWVARLGIDPARIRYAKVDTQGHEAHVLAGASGVLGLPGVVWEMEFSPAHLARAGRGVRDAIEQMQAAFSHFIDLNEEAEGERVREIAALPDALAYLGPSFTNLLLWRS